VKKMVAYLDEEFVLTAEIDKFEAQSRDYLIKHLEFVPEWTAKKGQ